jgi:hypothetical protein
MIFEAFQKGNLNPTKRLDAGHYNKTVLSEHVAMV